MMELSPARPPALQTVILQGKQRQTQGGQTSYASWGRELQRLSYANSVSAADTHL